MARKAKKAEDEGAVFAPKTIKVRITLMEEMLGAVNNDKDVYTKFLAKNIINDEEKLAEELASLPSARAAAKEDDLEEEDEKEVVVIDEDELDLEEELTIEERKALVEGRVDLKTTVYHRDTAGNPFIYDYVIKGFFKDACKSLRQVPGTKSNDLTSFKPLIDGLIFTFPRKLMISCAGSMDHCVRPLRVNGPMGERVTLARSETVPEGSVIETSIMLLNPRHEKLMHEWLQYGALKGLGQWRNSGKGRFSYEVIAD
jgi:hypothetical protein